MSLCSLPTPVERLPIGGASSASNAWIKRDDVTHVEYGGNKVRKLEFVAAEMLRRRARRAIMFGAMGTNAGVAAAMVCRQLGIACTVLTFDQPPAPSVAKNQALMRGYGAEVVHAGSLFATALRWYAHPRRLDPRAYFLFAGCSNPVATFGYVNAALELRAQIDAGLCPAPAEIVVAAGSAATLAGLTLGCAFARMDCRVIGVRVTPARVGPFAVCTPGVVRAMMTTCRDTVVRHCGRAASVDFPAPVLVDDWYGDGYGVPTQASTAAIDEGARAGVALDVTYTGKAYAAFQARVAATTNPVLFWNTLSSRAPVG